MGISPYRPGRHDGPVPGIGPLRCSSLGSQRCPARSPPAPSTSTFWSSALGSLESAPATTFKTSARGRRSPSWRGAETLAEHGTCSAIPGSDRTQTCTPSASASSPGRTPGRSPVALPSWTTSARPWPSTTWSVTSVSAISYHGPSGRATRPVGRSPPHLPPPARPQR